MRIENFFAAYQPWQVALALSLAEEMQRHGIDAATVADIARARLAEFVHNNSAATADIEQPLERQPVTYTEAELHCPRCGSALDIKQYCPGRVPHIRTAVACTNDTCSFWAHSKRTLQQIRQQGILEE